MNAIRPRANRTRPVVEGIADRKITEPHDVIVRTGGAALHLTPPPPPPRHGCAKAFAVYLRLQRIPDLVTRKEKVEGRDISGRRLSSRGKLPCIAADHVCVQRNYSLQ